MTDPIKKPSEFEQLRAAEENAAKLESVLSLFPAGNGAGLLSGALQMTDIQLRHARVPTEIIKAGQGKGFQEAFDKQYHTQKLPDVTRPTPTGLYMVEDTPKHVSEKLPFVHGHGVTAYGIAASKALTGKDYPVQLINRSPIEQEVGTTWVGTKPISDNVAVKQHGIDLAQGFLQKDFSKNNVNVFSASLVSTNNELKKPDDRMAGNKKISNYFGKNSVFVVASGNEETKRNPSFKHNALRNHPDTLLVGAAYATPATDASGKPIHAYSLTEYSASGADVLMVATPVGARYASVTNKGIRHLPQHGTSSATPQAAAAVAHLMRRFAASEQNKEAVLQKEDVLLAIKSTAQPVSTLIKDHVSYNINDPSAPEHRFSRTSRPLHQYEIGGRFVSVEAGNGMLDPKAAWELLEKQEKTVREGKAKILPRAEVTVQMKPTVHTEVKDLAIPTLPSDAPKTMYRYAVPVNNDFYVDQIMLDMTSPDLSSKLNGEPEGKKPRLFLMNPKKELAEISASSGAARAKIIETGEEFEIGSSFSIARPTGFQGSPLKGEWVLYSTEKIDDIRLNFNHSMSSAHVGMTVTPDKALQRRNRYRQNDFTASSPDTLNAMIRKNSLFLSEDLTQAAFPPHFTDIRLAQLTKEDRETAKKLLDARYKDRKDYVELSKAVASGDEKQVLNLMVKPKGHFAFMRDIAASESKENLIYLLKTDTAFATAKDPNPREGEAPSTALIEVVKRRDRKIETEVVQSFMDHGATIKHLKHQDNKGRTALHYARHSDVQLLLMNQDLNAPERPRMHEIKDKDGKTFSEIPWTEDVSLSFTTSGMGKINSVDMSNITPPMLPRTQDAIKDGPRK